MQGKIRPIRSLRRTAGPVGRKRPIGEASRAGRGLGDSRLSDWSTLLAARHLLQIRRGGWHPLDLVWRAARPFGATHISWGGNIHLSWLAKFISTSVAKAYAGSPAPTAAGLGVQAVPPTMLFLPPERALRLPQQSAALSPASRVSRNDRLRVQGQLLPLAARLLGERRAPSGASASFLEIPLRFLQTAGPVPPLAQRISGRVSRRESAYLPVQRAFASRGIATVDAELSNPANRAQRSSSSNFESIEMPARHATTPLDMQKLTDEVIQQIDRRIVATRERFGKR